MLKITSFPTVNKCPRCSSKRIIRNSRSYSTNNDQKSWRTIFEQFSSNNNLKPQDWYQVDVKNLDPKAAEVVNKQFKGSLYRALSTIFPETEWKAWQFQNNYVPMNYWKEQPNRKNFFDDLGQKVGVQTLDDWYEKLSRRDIEQHGGHRLLRVYNNSCTQALMASYPQHNWLPWKFETAPWHYWDSLENQRKYFDWLGNEIGIQQLDDWYQKLSVDTLMKHGGRTLIGKYNGSAIAAIMTVYNQHEWVPWKFNNVPMRFWKDINNQRKFIDDLGKQIGIKTLDDWYEHISPTLIIRHGGKTLLSMYNGSTWTMLSAIYPEHKWIPWKFKIDLKRVWNSKDNVKEFLPELSEKLSIQTLDDWYRVDRTQLAQLGAHRLVLKYQGLYNLLKEQYPHHPWDPKRFNQTGKKAQRWLAVTLKKMFPDEEILEDYQHPKAVSPLSKRPLQLDVYIPSRSLAFEYQGKQHYEEVGVFNPTRTYQQRDEEKRTLCAANNIKLIEVPYWWNRTKEELQEMMASVKI